MDANSMELGVALPDLQVSDCESAYEDISENEMNIDEVSDIEKSKICLYAGLQDLLEKSVEEIKINRTQRKNKRKRFVGNVGDGKDANAYSRCSLPYLSKVIASIKCSDHRISLVANMGFQEILNIDDCYVPRLFAQWLADNTVPEDGVMKFGLKTIPINPQAFVDVLGIPEGELQVLTDEECGKEAFLALLGLTEVPTIKYLGDKIINNKDLGDDEFCVCFGAVVLSTFICPNSSSKPSTKYMGALVDVKNIAKRNWSLFAHQWMICYIMKYLKERAKNKKFTITLGGCIYLQAVRYLAFIDLGPIKLPSTLPRIRVWKGDLIKHFSEMDKGSNGFYGAHIVRDVSQTCYSHPIIASTVHEFTDQVFKSELGRVGGEFLSGEVKDHLFEAFKSHMIDAEPESYLRSKLLVIDMLKIIVSEGVNVQTSEKTLVISQDSTREEYEDPTAQLPKKHKVDDSKTTDKLSQSDTDLGSRVRPKVDETFEEENNSPTNEIQVAEEKILVEPTFSHVKSFSLNHTASADEGTASMCKRDDNCNKGKSIKSEDVSATGRVTAEATFTRMRSLSLNHSASLDDVLSSSGLNKKKEEEVMSQKEVHKDSLGEGKAYFARTMTSIAQDYDGANKKYKGYSTKEEFLEEARKKYFFLDPSYPSMRLFEYEDDHGKYIEEEELWRPLPGDTNEEGNNNIEKDEEQINLNNSNNAVEVKEHLVEESSSVVRSVNSGFLHSPPTQINSLQQVNAVSDFEFSTIQCAQREPPVNFPQQNNIDDNDGKLQNDIIDLDPASQPSQPSQFTPPFKDNSTAIIKGRRLFQDDSDVVNLCTPSTELKLKEQVSPEVQFLGERSFNIVCNNMAAASDELYNAGLTLGTSSGSGGKENLQPKRIINRSSFLRSPYDQIQRPIIEPKQVKLHEIITTLCDDEQFKYKYVINIDNCRVFLKQLGSSLKMNGWVEAWVINAFCRKLFKDNHPRKSQKHWFFHTSSEYFLEKWPNEIIMNKWRESIIKGFHGADSARRLHLSHRLNFPSLYKGHWFVFLVDLVARKFLFLDSYYGESSSYHAEIDNMMIQNFIHTWNDSGLKDMGFNNYEVFFPNVPKQKTPNDCGIFTMKYMEFYCPRNPTACSFSADDVPAFRIQIAFDSVFNGYNSEIDNMHFLSSFDLKAYKSSKI